MLANTNASKWRVLVVDDEPDNLHLASEVLKFCGAAVAQADSGQKALELATAFVPNVILLDLAMPGMNGFEVHQVMRSDPALARVPIIALTALAMPQDADRVREAGFNGYITKPFHVQSLIKDIDSLVGDFHKANLHGHEHPEY